MLVKKKPGELPYTFDIELLPPLRVKNGLPIQIKIGSHKVLDKQEKADFHSFNTLGQKLQKVELKVEDFESTDLPIELA